MDDERLTQLVLDKLTIVSAGVHRVDVKTAEGFARMDERLAGLDERFRRHEEEDERVEQRVADLENRQIAEEASQQALVKAEKSASTARRSAVGGVAAGMVGFFYALIDAALKYWPWGGDSP